MGDTKKKIVECVLHENWRSESQALTGWRTEASALPLHNYCTTSEEM